MLSRRQGMTNALVKEVLSKGRSASSSNISLKFLKIDGGLARNSRFSFVVSSKVSRLAATRNLIKRRSRHIIKRSLDKLNGVYWCVFFFRPSASRLSFKELEQEILGLLIKTKVFF